MTAALPRDFSRLWAAETASALGDEVTGLALPMRTGDGTYSFEARRFGQG